MSIKGAKWIIAGLTSTSFIIILSSCAPIATFPTGLRDFPEEVESGLSPGDTRDKVYSVLGEPLIDASSLGIQVYQHSASDIQFDLFLPFIPHGLSRVHVFSLVAYDDNELVKEVATSLWTGESYGIDFSLNAGSYSFVNAAGYMPETLLGPAIPWREMVDKAFSANECTLVMLMGECPMTIVSLDKKKIADLHPAGYYCNPDLEQSERRKHVFYGTYINRKIEPGVHQIKVKRATLGSRTFETVFECKSGETVYTEFKAQSYLEWDWWHGRQLEGEILIHKTPPKSIIEMDTLRPILWCQDTWYGPPDLLRKTPDADDFYE
jgi:hypothetical protein